MPGLGRNRCWGSGHTWTRRHLSTSGAWCTSTNRGLASTPGEDNERAPNLPLLRATRDGESLSYKSLRGTIYPQRTQ